MTRVFSQILWCQRAETDIIATVDSETESIDAQISALLRRRAEQMVRRDRLVQRTESLTALGEAQKRSFQQFLSEHAAKDAELRECLRQASAGVAAGGVFLEEMGKLRVQITEEATALRTTAHEQLVDAGADLAWAFRLGHNANYMQGYYLEEFLASLKRDEEVQLGAYARALHEGRIDVAQEVSTKLIRLEETVAQKGEEVARLARDTVQMEQLAGPAVRFLFGHAVGGAVELAAPARASVRTGTAGRALWGGGDREISLPEEWEKKMREEAEAGVPLLQNI